MGRLSIQKGKNLKTISCYFMFFISLFLITGLCQASTIILTSTSPDQTVTSGSEETLYGTSASNRITLESGAKAELINFSGQNVIEIKADSNGFTVYRSGSLVTFEGTDGTVLKIPATSNLQMIHFNDTSYDLIIDNNQVFLENQVIGLSEVPVGPNPCTYSLSSSSNTFTSSGGTLIVFINASSSSCEWTASESLDWVGLSPTSGTGNGTITITVAANTDNARTGSITLAGQSYIINQTAPCTYSISPVSGNFSSSGESKTVSVTTSSPNCNWSTSELLIWVSLSPTSGTGSRIVTISASANTGAARSGSVTIAGETYTISQEPGCSFDISPSSNSFSDSGGTSSISVWASSSSCEWTASESLDWVSLSPRSGTGSGVISVTVDANTGDARSSLITIAEQNYTIIQAAVSTIDSCGANIAPGVWKEFDCYNLAAIGKFTGADPFIPSWELIGGYWQWGRKGPDPEEQDWYNTNTPNFAHGPTGPGVEDANEDEINGWDDGHAPDGAWSDSVKTANDPCPEGFRVPTIRQWEGVLENNSQGILGTWSNSATNYSSARFFGNNLMLPAAAKRYSLRGGLDYRGWHGNYWSSSVYGPTTENSLPLNFDVWDANVATNSSRKTGMSVRCIADDSFQPGTCGAYMIPGVWKEFDCYNLAAIGKTTNDDPFTPSWRLIGGYWQWGRKGPDPSVWYNTNTPHFAHGPTGMGVEDANEDEISGWDLTIAPDVSWTDSNKTVNDPCPEGFRVPTKSQWEGVLSTNWNPRRIEGTWSTTDWDHTNYHIAFFIGDRLMLPAAGNRKDYASGALGSRGYAGLYWSSSLWSDSAHYLSFYQSSWFLGSSAGYSRDRRYGLSVRCIAE